MRRTSLVLLALTLGGCADEPDPPPPTLVAAPDSARVDAPGVLYGRVHTTSAGVYEGRLRWGGTEEAFWGDFFNGVKDENPWAAYVSPDALAGARRPPTLFGIEVPWGEGEVELRRPFMARFGDLVRIEARGGVGEAVAGGALEPEVRVTLKSGTVLDLDRLSSSDFDDGLRVWDRQRGVTDLGARAICAVDFLPTPPLAGDLRRLHGTVHVGRRAFRGPLQWNRTGALASDVLTGRTADGDPFRVRFGDLRSVTRHDAGARLALTDGRELEWTGPGAGPDHRGLYVDDARYGRVLVSWAAVDRVEFEAGGTGPAYADYPPGRALAGAVVTRDGRRLAGRLVVDLDESETTETLDAHAQGVDYTLPLALVARVEVPESARVRVTLRSGETLVLSRSGDLGAGNAGVLVFGADAARPAYVPWADVARLDVDGPAASEG